MLQLYGHYASQPFRSVCWLLKIHDFPFNFIKVDPTSGDSKKPDYLAKFPSGLIPAMLDDNGVFSLSEASAIMIYLCEKQGWDEWYPSSNLERKARIHQYLSHHNESSRSLSRKAFRPALMKFIVNKRNNENSEWDEAKAYKVMQQQGKHFEDIFLHQSNYIAGDNPSIADLIAYPEFAQMPQVFGMEYDRSSLPKLTKWMDYMKNVPYHDDVHRTVLKMGLLVSENKRKKTNKGVQAQSKL